MSFAPEELWSRAEARAADAHAMQVLGAPSAVLMERVAVAIANLIETRWTAMRRLDVFAGPGHNGGDGLAVARVLAQRGWDCEVQLSGGEGNDMRQHQLERAQRVGVAVVASGPPRTDAVVVDALLGTGARGTLRPAVAEAAAALRGSRPVVAIDVPTGVDVDDGTVAPGAVRADLTVTVERSKLGLHVFPGREAAGEVVVVRIGIEGDQTGSQTSSQTGSQTGSQTTSASPKTCWISPAAPSIATLVTVQARALAAGHKGQRGHMGVWAGGVGTPGAAVLAATAGLRAGAGLMTWISRGAAVDAVVLGARPELMRASTPAEANVDAWVVGPGLTAPHASELGALLQWWRDDPQPAVWDAGGLAILADLGASALTAADAGRGTRVITPHPGEAARLWSVLQGRAVDAQEVQASRVAVARGLAAATGAFTVLKGSGTVVAAPSGELRVCVEGSGALATAGTGDVLAGLVGAWLTQRHAPLDICSAAVLVHARAGELAARHSDNAGRDVELGELRIPSAADVADAIPRALASLQGRSGVVGGFDEVDEADAWGVWHAGPREVAG